MKTLHNRADLSLCTSRATGELLASRGLERVRLWSYRVALERFDPRQATAAWRARLSGGYPERTILRPVGRLAKEKHIAHLTSALRSNDAVVLRVAGDGILRGELEGRLAGTAIAFLGLLEGQELSAVYASADAFVFSSRTETLGLALLEAKASELPLCAARRPAGAELVRNRVDGLWVEPSDQRSLARGLRTLGANASGRWRMHLAGRGGIAAASWSRAPASVRRHDTVAVACANPHRAGPADPACDRLSLTWLQTPISATAVRA